MSEDLTAEDQFENGIRLVRESHRRKVRMPPIPPVSDVYFVEFL